MKKVLALILVLLMAVSVLVACGDKTDEAKTTTIVTNADVPATTQAEVVTTVPVTTEPAVPVLTNETLLGKWVMSVGFDTLFESYMNLQLSEEEAEAMQDYLAMYDAMLGSLNMYIDIEFKADGKYQVSLDEEKMESFSTNLLNNVLDYLKNGGLEMIMSMSGSEVTLAEIEEALAKEGMTLDEYYDMMAEQLASEMDTESIFKGLGSEEGDYELTEDSLYIDMGTEEDFGISSEFEYEYDGKAIVLLENVDGETHPFTGSVLTKIG